MGSTSHQINLQADRNAQMQEQQQSWQSEENDKDRLWQEQQWLRQFEKTAEQWQNQFNKENEEWQRRFEAQNDYNSPAAQIERLKQAGVNPAAALQSIAGNAGLAAAGGSSQPTSPSPVSPSLPGPHGVSPVGAMSFSGVASGAQIFSSLAQLQDSLSSAASRGFETAAAQRKVQSEIDKNLSEVSRNLEEAGLTRTNNLLRQTFGPGKEFAEIRSIINDAALKEAQGKTEDSKQLLNRALAYVNNTKGKINEDSLPLLLKELQGKIDNLDADTRLKGAQTKTESTKQALNVATAENLDAETVYINALRKTEDDLRQGRVDAQTLANDISEVRKQIVTRQNNNEILVNDHYVNGLINQFEREGILNAELKEQLYKAVQENNWLFVDKYLSAVESVTRSFGNLLGGAASLRRAGVAERIQDIMEKDEITESHDVKNDDGSRSRYTVRRRR